MEADRSMPEVLCFPDVTVSRQGHIRAVRAARTYVSLLTKIGEELIVYMC